MPPAGSAARPARTGGPPLVVTPVRGLPEVCPGDDLGALVAAALRSCGLELRSGDVLVVSSKVVSKARGLSASAADREAAVRAESRRVVAERRTGAGTTRVVEAAAGPVMAAGGVDASNTGAPDRILLLPRDPDTEAERLREQILAAWGGTPPRVGVLLSDTAGRPWRAGQADFALGAAGLTVIEDLRGMPDGDGRELSVTSRALGDEIAAAADLVKGKSDRVPVAHVRGLAHLVPEAVGRRTLGAAVLVRTAGTEGTDWFRLGQAEAVRDALGVPAGSTLSERVGIPSADPEPLSARVDRALAVALHEMASPPRVLVEQDGRSVSLSGSDDFTLGVAASRLVTALRGEDVQVGWERAGEGVTLTLGTERGAGPRIVL